MMTVWLLRISRWCGCFLMVLLCGCEGPAGPADGDALGDLGSDVVVSGFDDHTWPRIESVAQYEENAAQAGGWQTMKFVLTRFGGPSDRAISYMDGNFYELHDEWYWYRLLNGARVPGDETAPVEGLSFASIEEVYQWASVQPELPLDLRFAGDRLYSPRFYDLALGEVRVLGLGGVIAVPARAGREAVWGFELEYSDDVTHAELKVFFEVLDATLPEGVSGEIVWLVRSPVQEALAVVMETEELAYHDRILRYWELAIPGEVEVYSEGLAAGRLRKIRGGEGLDRTSSTDVLLMDVVPDWLPAGLGLVTAVPQTPLAHINLLARNRGIPNAYLGGLMEEPSLDQWSRVAAPVILRAQKPDRLDIVSMTEEEFRTFRGLGSKPPISVPPVDVGTLPYVYRLSELASSEVEALRPVVGGKAAGFLGLMAPGGVTIPDAPMAITVRAYVEHLAPLRTSIQKMLGDPAFQTSARARYLVLEGSGDYDDRYMSAADLKYREDFVRNRAEGQVLGDMVRAGGLKRMIRDLPVEPSTLAAIEAEIEANFVGYSVLQGLRFRSSSTVEDIEGFNGAGLYDSNTGFLQPAVQPISTDRKKSVAWALKKTWASYWGVEAFEERRLESVDHLSGGMGVVVHARFDDAMEVSNGVFTLTVLPEGFAERAVMELNVQVGDLSVTNPENAELPEVVRVGLASDGGGTPVIERLRGSTLKPTGAWVLSDALLLSIFDQGLRVTEAWLVQENASLTPEKAGRTLTLDFEFREMAEGWPMLAGEVEPWPQRVVIKQARSLEPGLRGLPENVVGLPVPRDVLGRARKVERRLCEGDRLRVVWVEAYTDPLMSPDLGYSETPMVGFVSVTVTAAIPELGLSAGQVVVAPHTGLTVGYTRGAVWEMEVVFEGAAAIDRLIVGEDGGYRIAAGASEVSGTHSGCFAETLHASPEDYLMGLLEAKLGE